MNLIQCMRFFLLLPVLSLVACGQSASTATDDLATALSLEKEPTIGDLLIEQGGANVAEAAKLKRDGENSIEKAERQINEAENLRSQGEDDIRRAERLLADGTDEKDDVVETYCLRPPELRITAVVCER